MYALSSGGVVVALDYPLCHVECRVVATASADAFGMDADRVDFRFLSACDRMDVACNTCAAHPTWLVVSRVSAPTLLKNADWCRARAARIESPDQILQFTQLASIHAHWTVSVEAEVEEDAGPRISAVAVESHPANVHLVCESPLFKKDPMQVPVEALAIQAHDQQEEAAVAVLPPITGGPAVQRLDGAQPPGYQALTGGVAQNINAAPALPAASTAAPSLTEPGVSPTPGSWEGGTLAPARRTLDERRTEGIRATMSATEFVTFVDQFPQAQRQPAQSSSVQIEEVVGSLDGSEGQEQGVPRSYGPRTHGQQ